MNARALHSADLDTFVRECDKRGGPSAAAGDEYLSHFQFTPSTHVDQSLDPFSDAYFQQQVALYREITGRELNQSQGELTSVDIASHTAGCNPYNHSNIHFVAKHARVIQTCLLLADLPAGANILDMGAGWGMSSEVMAFCGAHVTAVDINPLFVELMRNRATRLGLPINPIQSEFDHFTDTHAYDMLLFYECLHHSPQPWATLARLGQLVKPEGKIIWAGEPVNQFWWKNWGLRLDGLSVYCMRKFGWWESGWSEEFITRCFARCGFTLTVLPGIGLDNGPIGFAVRTEHASRIRPAAISLTRLESQIATYNQQIADMRASLSWRITAPLRVFGRAVRKCCRLLRLPTIF